MTGPMIDRELLLERLERLAIVLDELMPQCAELVRDTIALLKEQDAQDATDIREIDGLWCDDITFCKEQCGWKSCPRNKQNIRDRTIPHSFQVGIPLDCPKWKEGRRK